MAVIFKIVFALCALYAVAYAFPSEAVKTEVKHAGSEGAHAAVESAVEQKHTAENKAHEQNKHKQEVQQLSSTTEDAHSRHKRGCKTVTYKKGGRTITAQKC